MEKEVKLAFKDKSSFDQLKESLLKANEAEQIQMKAIYYDTFDDALKNSGSAMRIRHENDNIILTVKSGGGSKAGMHERKEWNVKFYSEKIDFEKIQSSDIQTTDSIDEFYDIISLVQNKGLKELCRTDFTRFLFMFSDGDSVAEICLDEGNIISGEKTAPIFEVEIELHNGKESYIEELAEKFAKQYSLKAENRSKFARGLSLYLSN